MIETLFQSDSLTAIAFFGLWVGLWLPIAVPVAIALQWRPFQTITPQQKLPLVLTLYTVAPFALWMVNRATDRSWASYGWVFNVQLLASWGIGLLVGVVGLLLAYGLQVRLGWLNWVCSNEGSKSLTLGAIAQTSVLTLLLATVVGAVEELVFRGFLLNCLQGSAGIVSGAIASSAIFAILHLIWEGRKGLWQLPGLWLMGIALVLARSVDQGQLGLPWGLHAGWVWVVASLDALPGMQPSGQVPAWVTGIAGYPLAGMVGIGFMLLMAIALYVIERVGFMGTMG